MFSFLPIIEAQDLVSIAFLIFLEGVLSIDNALVLALIVGHLPPEQHKKALAYGMAGAVFFRIIAIFLATYLMQWTWVKFVGGAYLLYLAVHYWWEQRHTADKEIKKAKTVRGFWTTVLIVELTDIAFAIDSILTAVALTTKTWVVITGGILGLVLMRFAASQFILLLKKYPRFEPTAYILVFIIGAKLIIDGFHLDFINFHSVTNPAFWIFWLLMVGTICFGFTGRSSKNR